MKRLVCAAVLALVSACGLQTSTVSSGVDKASLADSGMGVAVIGFHAPTLGGTCDLYMGRAGSGSVTRGIGTGWRNDNETIVYGSRTFDAGAWELYQIACGNTLIHRPRSAKVLGFFGTTYDPLARFEVAAGETVYLGDLEIERLGVIGIGMVQLAVADRSEDAARAISAKVPQLAQDMQTRLIEIVPRKN